MLSYKILKLQGNFFPSHCVFQDMVTGKKIGRGYEVNNIYVLSNKINQSKYALSSAVTLTQWHY